MFIERYVFAKNPTPAGVEHRVLPHKFLYTYNPSGIKNIKLNHNG